VDELVVCRVVIGDDHPAIVAAVSRFLESEEGIELVGSASDGAAAERLIAERNPNVAILDVRMPQSGGIEIARRLTAAKSPTAVVLYTAFPDRALLLEALDAGVRGFLLKEAPLVDLLRAITMVAEGGTYVDPKLAPHLIAGTEASERVTTLTKREREILRLLADGMRNDAIATQLHLSSHTVRTHITKAMTKLEADTRTQAVASALRQSLIQ
jgi:DNA-binding NarL/FixJ family response regulator